jgi:hypothetical protein
MNYELFNPDHEIALAMNVKQFIPSRNVSQMKSDLAFLPALWAKKGDAIIVDNKAKAEQAYAAIPLKHHTDVRFITMKDTALEIQANASINPWGWNMALREQFLQAGVPAELLPTEEKLRELRLLMGRTTAVQLSTRMQSVRRTVGIAEVCRHTYEVDEYLELYKNIVVKAPYSSSGRGVRFVNHIDDATSKWINNVIRQQEYITVERKYDKILDFAIELTAEADGSIKYEGLSVFSTNGGTYSGNILASEEEKMLMLTKYVSSKDIEKIICEVSRHLTDIIGKKYIGPLGVDMMIVTRHDEPGYHVHSSVEINLRRTMGHVALALSQRGEHGVMQTIIANGHFHLQLTNTENAK